MDNAKGILNGRRDEPLSEKGIEQAEEVADKIKTTGINFNHVYSSPLKRAYKTAEIITDTQRSIKYVPFWKLRIA